MTTKTPNLLSLINIFFSNLNEFLSFSIALLDALSTKWPELTVINPENIIVEKKNDNYIISFDFNQTLDPFSKGLYLSPEIKKEIDREIDHRSGLYSIGITFHLLLTKQYPIITSGTHINFSTNETIPQTIQFIVEKLICRFPEDRYHSINGIKADLVKAKNELEKTGEIKPFFPGIDDKPIDLKFCNYLYGRTEELTALIEYNEQANHTAPIKTSLFIIYGPSGIGKTLLAEKALERIQTNHPIKLSCKSEQSEEIPFKILTELINNILVYSNSENCSLALKQKLNKTINKYQALIQYLLPNTVFNNNNPSPIKQNHLNFSNLLIDLFNSITENNTVAIFLDDLQWIDSASLTPILLATSYISQNLIIIGTSRKKFTKKQPLINQLFETKGSPSQTLKTSFNTIKSTLLPLTGLKLEEIKEHIEDLLLCNENESEKLSTILYSKTEGNPLYIQQLLVSFKERNLLWFDKKKNEWVWKLSEIEKETVSENVANLLIKKIQTLPKDSQKVLHYASLLGHTFDPSFIAKIINQDLISIELNLWHATSKKLIVEINTNNNTTQYKFLHDKIQHACMTDGQFNLIESHAIVGKALLNKFGKETSSESLGNITYHLNKSIGFLNNIELIDLIYLNKAYGDQLLKSLSDTSAEKYYTMALEIYHKYAINNIELLEKLYFSKVTACQLAGRFTTALRILKRIELEIDSKRNKQKVLLKRIDILTVQSNYKSLLSIGITELQKLYPKLKTTPSSFETISLFISTFIKLLLHINNITKLPNKLSENDIFSSQLFSELTGGAYFYNKNTYIQLICKSIAFTLKKGLSKDTPFILIQFSNILIIKFKCYRLAKKLASIALNLLPIESTSKYSHQTQFIHTIFIARWYEPLDIILQKLLASIDICKKNNEITFATYSITQSIFILIGSGAELHKVQETIEKNNPFIYTVGFSDTIHTLEIAKSFISSLITGHTPYKTKNFDEKTSVNEMYTNGLTVPYGWYFICKLKTMYFLEKTNDACFFGTEAQKHLPHLLGLNEVEEHCLYYGLALIERNIIQKNTSRKNTKTIKKCLSLYKKWSKQNPLNFLAKYYLLLGTYYDYKKQKNKAASLYKKSIKNADINKQINIEALGHEKLGKLTINSNKALSNTHIHHAINGYKKWGATAKVRLLDNYLKKNMSKHIVN